ncbi:jg26694, partial [Pararge aegeria aegeria]
LLDTIQLVQSLRSYLPPPHIQVTSWKNDDKLRSNNMEELESRKIVSGN